MSTENNRNYEEEKLFGVYNVEPVTGKSSVIIKHVDNIKLGSYQSVADECIDEFKLRDEVYGRIYKCNILNTYLLSSKKQPILYMTVIYELPLRKFLLFKIYLYFTIETNVKSEKELIDNKLDGSFSLEVIIDEKNKELDKKIEEYPGLEEVKKMISKFVKTDGMSQLVDDLVDIHVKQLTEMYKDNFSFSKPKPTISLKDYSQDVTEEKEED